MRLTEEQKQNKHEACLVALNEMLEEQKTYHRNNKHDLNRRYEYDLKIMALEESIKALDTTEVQQELLKKELKMQYESVGILAQEIEQLKLEAHNDGLYSDRVGRLVEANEQLRQQVAEVEQLKAEAATQDMILKEYCKNIVEYTAENIRLQQEVSIVKDSIYWKFKKLLSAAPTDYHNPADVEVLAKVKYWLTEYISQEDCCSDSCGTQRGYETRETAIQKAIKVIGDKDKAKTRELPESIKYSKCTLCEPDENCSERCQSMIKGRDFSHVRFTIPSTE